MQTKILYPLTLLFSLFLASCTSVPTPKVTSKLDIPPKALNAVGKIHPLFIQEPAGIVKSPNQENVYWVISGSDNKVSRIFPVHQDGSVIVPQGRTNFQGILVEGATNQDWQDIALDTEGNITIADTGDKLNKRSTRVIYSIKEPNLDIDETAQMLTKATFSLPDRPKDKDPQLDNYNIEATFSANGKNYFLSKNKSDSATKLYQLEKPSYIDINEVRIIDAFDVGGLVSAATVSDDGKTLIILTYNGIWKFDAFEEGQYFDGNISYLPIYAGKSQGVCFADPQTLVILNSEGDLFNVNLNEFVEVSKKEPTTSWLSWSF